MDLSSFYYSVISGKLYRNNKLVNSKTGDGYLKVTIDYRTYLMHVIIWKLVTGEWPKDEIDHVDRNGSNNCWINLREATRSENNHNRSFHKRSELKVKGISKDGNRFRADICIDNKRINLGRFDTLEEAMAARKKAELDRFFPIN